MTELPPPEKTCRRCGQSKPVTEFSACAKNKDGLQTYCKECMRELANKRYKESKGLNPDLEAFSPRQLIAELRARGYRGELEYRQVIKL